MLRSRARWLETRSTVTTKRIIRKRSAVSQRRSGGGTRSVNQPFSTYRTAIVKCSDGWPTSPALLAWLVGPALTPVVYASYTLRAQGMIGMTFHPRRCDSHGLHVTILWSS